ncbi:MAG: PAS domain-containing protein [Armatimonadota bacterium]
MNDDKLTAGSPPGDGHAEKQRQPQVSHLSRLPPLSGVGLESHLLERALFMANCGVLITDAVPKQNYILFANPRFERMTGYTLGEVLGQNCRFLQGPDTDSATLQEIRKALIAERECRVVIRNYRKDGSAFWNELAISPVRDEAGQLTHFLGIQLDVSDRRLSEEEAGKARLLADGIVETLREPLAVLDGDLRVVSINQAFRESFQVTDLETSGQLFYRLGNGQWDIPPLRHLLEEVLPANKSFRDFEVSHDFPAIGTRTMLLNGRRLETDDGLPNLILLAFQDVTDNRRGLEAVLRLQNEQAATTLRQRNFLREILQSVTEGRLQLCDSAEQLPPQLPACGEPVPLTDPSALRTMRLRIREATRAAGFPEERQADAETSVAEAAMNAVLHGGGGVGQVCTDTDSGVVQVLIQDQGKGIPEESLHRATLERGWTTAGTLGHGFWLVLSTCDRVFLLTGSEGTTLILEHEKTPAPPPWVTA